MIDKIRIPNSVWIIIDSGIMSNHDKINGKCDLVAKIFGERKEQ